MYDYHRLFLCSNMFAKAAGHHPISVAPIHSAQSSDRNHVNEITAFRTRGGEDAALTGSTSNQILRLPYRSYNAEKA